MKAGNVHQYLGLARKANKCAFGALVKDSIIKKRAYVVLIDEGASANTKKNIMIHAGFTISEFLRWKRD